MPTDIKLKNSVTATNAPTSLQQGEVAINITDKKVWVGNAATTPVLLLGSGADGTFTNLTVSGVASFADGTVSLPSITNIGDTNTGIYFPDADTIAFTEGGVESMRINSSGNLGIGIASYSARLAVHNASSTGEIGRFSSAQATGEIQLNLGFTTTNQVAMFYDMGTGDGGLSTNVGSANLIFKTVSTERMRIVSGGDVGINTTSPTVFANKNLEVNGTGDSSFNLGVGGTHTAYFYTTASSTSLGSRTNIPLVFNTNNAERMRIDSSGNAMIGTTSANGKLRVLQSSTSDRTITASAPASYQATLFRSDCAAASATDWYHLYGSSSGGIVNNIFIYGNGNIQNANNSYGGISDIKLKENIVDATPKLDKLMQVKVRNYNFKGEYDQHKQIGVIAQELETVFPSMIEETQDRGVGDELLETTTKSVKYSVFVPMLIKALQELNAKVDAQAAEIAILKGN